MRISLDTETTGVDFYHGTRPFFVTTCDEQGQQRWWEWEVDPLTRLPEIPPEDIGAIQWLLRDKDLVLQNAKFDVAALKYISPAFAAWPWDRTDDTLFMAHLVGSNQRKDLTSLALEYLGVNIQPYEDRLEECVQQCRRYCRSHLPTWRIAKADLPEMPSAGEKTWKYDTWLPRALAKHLGHPPEHPYWTVLRDYANADSAVTLPLYGVLMAEIQRRRLENTYQMRRRIPRIAHALEWRGLTLHGGRLEELVGRYSQEAAAFKQDCVQIAANAGYTLEMPKGASPNASLRRFCFDVLKLEPIRGKKSKTDAPTLAKEAMEYYLATLPSDSVAFQFLKTLGAKRKRDTAVAYMKGYQRFSLALTQNIASVGKPEVDAADWYVLHPSLNPTGTDTLRWSSSNPNEQNISKQEQECEACEGEGCEKCYGTGKAFRSLRYCFGPAPGREWWSLDYKNLELRIPFYKSGQQELIELFERPDDPPYYGSNHLANFHAVYPDIWAEVEREVGLEKAGPTCKKRFASSYYQWCKNGGFCKQYGGQRALTDATFRRKGAYDLLEAKFDRLAELTRQCIHFADQHGYIETFPDKTIDPDRGYPLLCTRTEYGKVKPTVPLSFKVQGTAMWLTTMAMIYCQEKLDEWNRLEPGADYAMALQVHDELVFDFPRRGDPVAEAKMNGGRGPLFRTQAHSNLWRIRVMRRLMEKGGDNIDVPTPVGVEYHPHNWSEGTTL